MIIDKDHILKLADLAKITISEEEVNSYISDINKILELISQIKNVNTDGVEPLSNVLDQLSKTREDKSAINLDRDSAMENAPDNDGVYFQVPPTIKHNKEKN
tara:strand:- start:340 stop:645 length:306 start_codon:yes stop_codon:yes gene_type:complete